MCLTPISVKGSKNPVPCGSCPACRERRAVQWAFRLQQEYKYSDSAYFVTLTYDTDYVPINKEGKLTIYKKDIQDFFKRLRRSGEPSRRAEKRFLKLVPTYIITGEPKQIRYYAVGEYGGYTNRPHYHIIIFNVSPGDIELAWSTTNYERQGSVPNRISTLRRSKRSNNSLHAKIHVQTIKN